MALTPTQEAQVIQLTDNQAALLSLAGNETTITSKLGATKVNMSELPAATAAADSDIYLVRQGTTDKSIAGSALKAYAKPADATDTTSGIVALAVAANYPSVSDAEAATPAYVTSAIASSTTSEKIRFLRTPTVSVNTLTVGVNPVALDFRSATLTSSTVNTRVLSAVASLTIPQGASLGATGGVQADFVIGLMDNAGTLEPFVINLAGGVDLSETGLISTTAISASSTAANVAYSATARSNLPYRICGFYRNTQALAGTYVTAPSLVQGMGGQALASLSSQGYGQTVQNLTASRALSTTYFNTTGKPIKVSVAINIGAYTAGTSPVAVLTVSGIQIYGGSVTTVSGATSAVSYDIPPGGSYSATSSTGTPAINQWIETR